MYAATLSEVLEVGTCRLGPYNKSVAEWRKYNRLGRPLDWLSKRYAVYENGLAVQQQDFQLLDEIASGK